MSYLVKTCSRALWAHVAARTSRTPAVRRCSTQATTPAVKRSAAVQDQDGEAKRSLTLPNAAWACLTCSAENVFSSPHCEFCLTIRDIEPQTPLPPAKNAPEDQSPTCRQCHKINGTLLHDVCQECSLKLNLPWSPRRRIPPRKFVPAVEKKMKEEAQQMQAEALKCKLEQQRKRDVHLEEIAKHTRHYMVYKARTAWRNVTSATSVPIDDFVNWYRDQPSIDCLPKNIPHDLLRNIMKNAAGMQETVGLQAFTLFIQRFGPLERSFVKMAVLCQSDGTKQPWWNPCPGATTPKTHVTKFLKTLKKRDRVNTGWYLEPHRKPGKYPGGFSLIFESDNGLGFSEFVMFNDVAGLFCRDDGKHLYYQNLVAALNHAEIYAFIGFSEKEFYKRHCTWPQQLRSTTQQPGCPVVGSETEKAYEREKNPKKQLLQAQQTKAKQEAWEREDHFKHQLRQAQAPQTCDKAVQTDTFATLPDTTCVQVTSVEN
jgi:hypothetical protein